MSFLWFNYVQQSYDILPESLWMKLSWLHTNLRIMYCLWVSVASHANCYNHCFLLSFRCIIVSESIAFGFIKKKKHLIYKRCVFTKKAFNIKRFLFHSWFSFVLLLKPKVASAMDGDSAFSVIYKSEYVQTKGLE
jgi:hypothetical protein